MSIQPKTRTIRHLVPRRFDWPVALLSLVAGVVALIEVVTTRSPIAGSLAGGLSDAEYAQAFFVSPDVGSVALLLLALAATTLGGAWLVVRLLHWRFRPTFEPLKVWRQAVWAALFVAIGTWLQLFRALTIPLGALIAGAFVLIEVYLSVRERRE
jgi:hypothetical protein